MNLCHTADLSPGSWNPARLKMSLFCYICLFPCVYVRDKFLYLSPCLFSYSSLQSFFFGLQHRRRKTHRKDRRSDLFKDQCVINHKLAALREEEMYDSSLCGFLSLSSWHFLILVLLFNKCEFLSSPPICVTDQGLYLLPLILFKNCFPII